MAVDDNRPGRPIHRTKDVIILSLKSFFAGHSEFTWSSNSGEAKLSISDAFPVDKDKKESYPAIIVQRHDFSWRNRHLNQTVYNNLQDQQSGLDLIKGTFTCLCVSTLGLEAERLAEDVFLFFTRFRNVISAKGLFDIKDLTIGTEAVQKAGADTDLVIVPVRLGVSAEDSWTLIEKGSFLKEFDIRLESTI